MPTVRGDTPDFSKPSLCDSCKNATIIKGVAFDEKVVKCPYFGHQGVPFRVTECKAYLDINHPYVNEMEEIAWLLVTKTTTNQIGFIRAKDLSDEERRKYAVEPRNRPVGR